MSAAKSLEHTAIAAVEKRMRAAIAKLGEKLTDIEIEMWIANELPDVRQALRQEQSTLDQHVYTLRMSIALMHVNKCVFVRDSDEAAMRAADAKRRPLVVRLEDVAHEATVTPAPRVPPQLGPGRARGRAKPNETVVREPPQLLLGPAPAPLPAVGFRAVVDAIPSRLDVTPRRRPA